MACLGWPGRRGTCGVLVRGALLGLRADWLGCRRGRESWKLVTEHASQGGLLVELAEWSGGQVVGRTPGSVEIFVLLC